jgi:nucleoside-diphosphate-sugar epimerase
MAATSMRDGAASLPPYPGLARDALAPLRVLVTGAAGFVGQRLVLALLKHGALRVRMFDWRPAPLPPSSLCSEAELARVEAMQGDIRRDTDVYSALRDMDAVMHVASFGMGGREMVGSS